MNAQVSDKTLFPLCDFNNTGGLHEDCFDLGSQDLMLGDQHLQKRSQYSFIRHRGFDGSEEEAEAEKQQQDYRPA